MSDLRLYKFSFLIKLSILVISLFSSRVNYARQSEPTLRGFFEKLKAISPIDEALQYKAFSDFDFVKFVPIENKQNSKVIRFKVGFSSDKKLREVQFVENGKTTGVMSIYYFDSLKIITLNKKDIILNEYPDFPIFCITENSKFIIYLKTEFQFGTFYQPTDIISVQILRDDLYPICIMSIRDEYVRMLTKVSYLKTTPTTVNNCTVIIPFQPETDEYMRVTEQSTFTSDYFVPRGDFIATLKPRFGNEKMPIWYYINTLDFD